MEPPPEKPSPQRTGEVYRARKTGRKHRHRRPRKRVLVGVSAAVLLLAMASLYYYYANRRPTMAIPSPVTPADRRALIAAVNKIVAQTGKDVPRADVVVDNASLHERDGRVYLQGTLRDQSSRPYPKVHVAFDTLDHHRNPAGIVEGDVTGLEPQKTVSFDFGPVNPDVRSFSVRSIEPEQ
jgi:hypothetical protein